MAASSVPERALEVFAELPERFRRSGQPSAWFFGKEAATAHSFLEGPAFDRAGRLWVVDIPFGRLFRISPDGRDWELAAEYDGEPNGLAIHRDGRVFIADHRQGLMVLDPGTGRVEPLLPRVRREGFKGLNDLTFARNGDLYFTDQGQTSLADPTGRLWRLRAADGKPECLLDNVPSPNGLVLTSDERALLLAVTRANQIWRVQLHPDGSVGKVGIFVQLSGGLIGPDGLALDETGGLVVAHAGFGTVWLLSRLGEPRLRLGSPRGLSVTNVCFGGEGGRSLFVTESDSGSILRAELDVAGAPLFSHAAAGNP
ncbi:MAG: SMP-30/gluconolactonase/LRE family protein [Lautropia sp.]